MVFIAASQAASASSDAVGGTGAAIAVLVLMLGVAAMFGLLFWTRPGFITGGDPTGVLENERRNRLNQNPAYSG